MADPGKPGGGGGSAIRRLLLGYFVIVGLLCGGFAILALAMVATADRERAVALIESDAAETLEKIGSPGPLRREKALAIVLARSAMRDERLYRLQERGTVIAGLRGDAQFDPIGRGWLAASEPPAMARRYDLAPGLDLLIGRRLEQGALTHRLLLIGTLLLIAALLAAVVVGWWAVRSLTARIAAINAACDRVRLGDFTARAPRGESGDEFAMLADHVNAMLERIDALVSGMRDVSNRIAHDLRTPVARLRGDLEEAATALTLSDARRLAGVAAAETDDILQTFEALLDIAEVEAGGGGLAPMRLDDAVRSACELYATVAEATGVRLQTALDAASIIGERTLIVRLAANLIDNAIKFSPPGATVTILVHVEGRQVALTVSDSGPGIPETEREHVMGRLARGAAAKDVPGHGLGLALVSAVAKRHGAMIAMRDALPGLRVEIRFERFREQL